MSSFKRRGKSTPAGEPTSQKKSRTLNQGESVPSPLTWNNSGVQILLPCGHHIIFTGTGILSVQSGEIALSGSIFSSNTSNIHISAEEDAPLVIQAIAAETTTIPLASHGSASFAIQANPDKINSREGIHSDPIKTSNTPKKNKMTATNSHLSFSVYLDSDSTAPIPIHSNLPSVWLDSLAAISSSIKAAQMTGTARSHPLLFICGSKNVGKSSYARSLVNRLLSIHSTVAYLDTDCGQPEFTPPGLVSLHFLQQPVLGAPHLHQRLPYAAHFMGDTSPAVDPGRFQRAITSLYEEYCSKCNKHMEQGILVPLIVNTNGWIKGLGLEMLVNMLRSLPITHYIHILSTNLKKNLPQGPFWHSYDASDAATSSDITEQGSAAGTISIPIMYDIPGIQACIKDEGGIAHQTSGPSATEQRSLHWTAFAQACCIQSSTLQTTKSIGDRLAEELPYAIGLKDIKLSVLYCTVDPSEVYRVLNGSVVGLCTTASVIDIARSRRRHGTQQLKRKIAQQTKQSSATSEGAIPFCVGLGIVRSVDSTTGTLYVLTPLHEDVLNAFINVIEVGRLELVPFILQTDTYSSPYLALNSLSINGTGAGVMRSRNNLLRTSQLDNEYSNRDFWM